MVFFFTRSNSSLGLNKNTLLLVISLNIFISEQINGIEKLPDSITVIPKLSQKEGAI